MLSEEQVGNLRALLKGIGLGTASIDVVSTQRKCHYQNTLRIVLGPGQSVAAFKIAEILEREGHRNPNLIWEKGDRTRCGASRSIEPQDFLRKAIAEGLKEDGADRAFVKEFIADKHDLFVPKCRICDSVRAAFAEYGTSVDKPAPGKGIPKDVVDELKNAARVAKLNALERLVDGYVSRHYERLKLNAEERAKLQAKLEDLKKEGMKMKELGSPNFGDFCPSCNAAAKQR